LPRSKADIRKDKIREAQEHYASAKQAEAITEATQHKMFRNISQLAKDRDKLSSIKVNLLTNRHDSGSANKENRTSHKVHEETQQQIPPTEHHERAVSVAIKEKGGHTYSGVKVTVKQLPGYINERVYYRQHVRARIMS